MKTRRCVVLLSGGQDSTTCAYIARMLFDEVHAISIHYGQRHASELEAAERTARAIDATFELLTAPALAAIGGSALVDAGAPLCSSGGIPDVGAPNGLPTSFVPGRNLWFLAMAASVAVREGAHDIFTGTCQTDYSGYPDCREEFIRAAELAIAQAMPSSAGPLRLHTPLMHIDKAATVRLARRLPGCWEALAWSVTCYEGRLPGCGACPACVLRARGFEAAGEPDPAGLARGS